MLPLPTELMLRRKEDNQYLLLTYTFKSRSVAKKKKKKMQTVTLPVRIILARLFSLFYFSPFDGSWNGNSV